VPLTTVLEPPALPWPEVGFPPVVVVNSAAPPPPPEPPFAPVEVAFIPPPPPPPTDVIDPLVAAEFVTVPVPKTELDPEFPWKPPPETEAPPAPTVTV
jgi:hypothetical protein